MGEHDALLGLPDEPVIEVPGDDDSTSTPEPDDDGLVFLTDEIPEGADEAVVEPDEGGEIVEEEQKGLVPDVDQLRELQVQQLRDERDHWQRQHDDMTGKVSQKIDKLTEDNRRLQGQLDAGGIDGAQAPPRASTPLAEDPRLTALAEDLEDRRKRDANGMYGIAVQEFAGQFPNLDGTLADGIREHMKANAGKIRVAVDSSDPERVRMVTTQLLTEGLVQSMQGRRTENMSRQAKTAARVQAQKTLTTPPTQMKTRSMPSKPLTPADIEKMPPEKQKKALEAYFRAVGRKGF